MPTHLGPARFQSLDVLRGIAILGTLATNIWIFTNPSGFPGYLAGVGRDQLSPLARAAEMTLQQLAQGKFLGLLTIMFGIGLELQRRSAVRRGERWPGGYLWRAALLLVDGVLHFLLVTEFDVLMGYAVTGAVVAYLLATSERAQRLIMVVMAGLHLLMLTGVTLLLASLPPVPAEPLDPNPYADGSWWDLVLFRIDNLALFRIEPVFILALSIATFLLGARLLRAGVLEPAGRRLRRRLMFIGGIALPVDFALPLLLGEAGIVAARYGTAPLVALAILAIVVHWVETRPETGVFRRQVAAVGRMALSCYVAQNLVASAICYGWGLGLASRVPPSDRVGFTIGVYLVVTAVVIVFARVWLRWFDRGPLELLWNWSYRKLNRSPGELAPSPAPEVRMSRQGHRPN